MQWLPARATSVALGLAAAMTLLPMALLRHSHSVPFATRECLMDITAEHEVHHLHDKLQAWFRADVGADALEDLMAHFCADFSMVGIAGRRLDRKAVQALFAGGHGARPGLQIPSKPCRRWMRCHRWWCCAIAKGIRSMAASPHGESRWRCCARSRGVGVGLRCTKCRWPDRQCRPLAGNRVTRPGIMKLPASGRHYRSLASAAAPRAHVPSVLPASAAECKPAHTSRLGAGVGLRLPAGRGCPCVCVPSL